MRVQHLHRARRRHRVLAVRCENKTQAKPTPGAAQGSISKGSTKGAAKKKRSVAQLGKDAQTDANFIAACKEWNAAEKTGGGHMQKAA